MVGILLQENKELATASIQFFVVIAILVALGNDTREARDNHVYLSIIVLYIMKDHRYETKSMTHSASSREIG